MVTIKVEHFHVQVIGPNNDEILERLHVIEKLLKEIKMDNAEALVILKDIDTTTNASAANLQSIVDAQTEQVGVVTEIGSDVDSLLALIKAGGTVSPEVADALNALKQKAADSAANSAKIAQATKDQIPTLKAIAAKNDVPVPPPPTPPSLP